MSPRDKSVAHKAVPDARKSKKGARGGGVVWYDVVWWVGASFWGEGKVKLESGTGLKTARSHQGPSVARAPGPPPGQILRRTFGHVAGSAPVHRRPAGPRLHLAERDGAFEGGQHDLICTFVPSCNPLSPCPCAYLHQQHIVSFCSFLRTTLENRQQLPSHAPDFGRPQRGHGSHIDDTRHDNQPLVVAAVGRQHLSADRNADEARKGDL